MYETPYHDKPIDSTRFLITGGAGFIGSNIVEYLLKHGAKKVRVLDSLLTGRIENLAAFRDHPRFEFVEGDIRNPEDCRQACEDIDIISHQAALVSIPRSIQDPATTHEINASGFVNMLVAARDAGIERVVYASSSSVYGDDVGLPKVEHKIGRQISPYAVSKYMNELYSYVFGKLYKQKLIGLRYFNVFGPKQDPKGEYAAVIPLFIDLMLQGKRPFLNGNGQNTRDFTYIENVVQANVKAMLTEREDAFGEVYNVACGERFSVMDLFEAIREILQIEMAPQFRENRPGDIPHSLADISRAREKLSYDPQLSFKEGLAMTIAYYQKQYPLP